MPRPRSWARADYERMVKAGILGPRDRVELLEGEILEMSPEGSPELSRHAAAIDLALEALRRAFGPGFTVRVQHPLALSDHSEPEPDLAVVPGTPRDYVDQHPAAAILVFEVSDSSLHYDRTRKMAAYARAGVPDYWIVNLVVRRLEVHRDPSDNGYHSVFALESGAAIAPLGASEAAVPVADLLP